MAPKGILSSSHVCVRPSRESARAGGCQDDRLRIAHGFDMITLADTLSAECVGLGLRPHDHRAAVRAVAELLRPLPAVLDWQLLFTGLLNSCPCLAETGSEFAICLPHVRTDAVSAMVMSVGRFVPGIRFPNCALPVRYIFCIGAPTALANDYPRLVGLLARVFKDPEAEAQICAAATPEEFVDRLRTLEAKL